MGVRVRRLRQERGLQQSQLALRAGVNQPWVSQLEKGLIEDPGVERMTALARVLATTVEYLVEGREPRGEVDPDLSDTERRFLRFFRGLRPRYQAWVLRQAEQAVEQRLLDSPESPQGEHEQDEPEQGRA